MKIKRLIIKNIASIESGDIDFEKGLRDPFTGNKAPLFLISGDTGSGKSAILDCISLTLYGTTPRVVGVNGVRSNKYLVGDKAISISDVRQYTRLGIGTKDECYARLFFVGNDGIDYVSTFYLGMTTHGNLAKARWTLDISTETTLEQEKNVAPRILEAVGLTYEQFSRMAMLAQGQFASFLTGGKEERERILEQLTSTHRFSEYGKAISNIYKRKKQAKEILETRLTSEKNHILSQEDESRLKDKIENDGKHLKSIREQLKLINKILDLRKTIEVSTESINKATEELAVIRKQQNSVEYKTLTETLKLWDETSRLRALTSEKKRVNTRIDSTVENLKAKLRNDGRINIEAFSNSTESSHSEKVFITISYAEKIITAYDRQINVLTSEFSSTVGDKGISTLRNQAKVLTDQIKDIDYLIELSHSLKTERKAIDISLQEETGLASKIKEIEESFANSQTQLEEFKKISEEADRRFTTMHLSLSENFQSLRKRLREEEASDCPLCGRPMDNPEHWKVNDETFSQILSPLGKEKEIARENLAKAISGHNVILELLNKSKGELKALNSQNKKILVKLESNEAIFLNRLKKYGVSSLDCDISLLIEIRNKIFEEEKILDSQISKADKIQKEILELRDKDELFVAQLRNEIAILGNLSEELTRISNDQKIALSSTGLTADSLESLISEEKNIQRYRSIKEKLDHSLTALSSLRKAETARLTEAKESLSELDSKQKDDLKDIKDKVKIHLKTAELIEKKDTLQIQTDALLKEYGSDIAALELNEDNKHKYEILAKEVESQREDFLRWNKLNNYFGGTRFRTLVQSFILRPLLANANRYLERITDHFTLTCSDENEQLAILVLDRYNKNQIRSATILSGGERFMISLALSLALSSLNKPDMNVDILFIDEGFGTLDSSSLTSVIDTLRRLPEIAGQNDRRVGVISHREELADEIAVKIKVERCGEGRSRIKIENQ